MKNDKEPKDSLEKYRSFWKKHGKFILFWVITVVTITLIVQWKRESKQFEKNFGCNEFIEAAQNQEIKSVTIEPRDNIYKLSGNLVGAKEGKKFFLPILKEYKFENLDLGTFMNKYNIQFTIKDRVGNPLWSLLFWVLLIVMLYFILLRPLKQQRKLIDSQKENTFTEAKARQKIGEQVTFRDVAGLKEAKEELKETIDFLKNPTKFSRLGSRVPRGILLVGPAGSGKTLLARAVAGEAEANFFSMSGSEFVEMFVGVGAARVRGLFGTARKHTPAIVFIDELDALGRSRGAGIGGGHDEREQTLNQLLVELDGFDQREGIVLLAATNRPDILDAALLRPGRFDRKIYTNLPDIEDREAILGVHTRNKPLADNVDLKIIARGTPGFSGAHLENLSNEAALRAARKGKEKIGMEDFEWAKDKVLMGAEKKIIITEKEKRSTAYHEAGHALVALCCPEADPLHKVSIIPRGQALGVTVQLPLLDKHIYSKNYLESQLTILMGGRAAEEIFMNQLTTSASNDIEVATGVAKRMVCDFGMSDLGPLSFGKKEGEIFLGRDFAQVQDYSDDTAKKIDEEVKKIIDSAYQKAKNILEKNKEKAEKLFELLLNKETLDGEEVKKLLNI